MLLLLLIESTCQLEEFDTRVLACDPDVRAWWDARRKIYENAVKENFV